jgi:hypothetical protein
MNSTDRSIQFQLTTKIFDFNRHALEGALLADARLL